MIYEGLNGTSMSGKMIKHKKGSMAVTIPADASHITIEHHKPVVKDGTASTMRTQHVQAVPKFATQGTITGISPGFSFQVADTTPTPTRSLVELKGATPLAFPIGWSPPLRALHWQGMFLVSQ